MATGVAGSSPVLATHCDGVTEDEGTEPCPTPTPTAEPTPTPTPTATPTPTPSPEPSPQVVTLAPDDMQRFVNAANAVVVGLIFVVVLLAISTVNIYRP